MTYLFSSEAMDIGSEQFGSFEVVNDNEKANMNGIGDGVTESDFCLSMELS